MKKILCAVLAFVLVCSLSVSAFAAGSVTAPVADGEATAALPEMVTEVEIVDANGNTVKLAPEASVTLSADEAEKTLEGEDLEAFEKAYEAAKAEKDYVVTNFFWLDVADDYKDAVSEGNGLSLTFSVPGYKAGDQVKVTVNGVEIPAEYIIINPDGTITVLFYKFGAVAIMTKAAE